MLEGALSGGGRAQTPHWRTEPYSRAPPLYSEYGGSGGDETLDSSAAMGGLCASLLAPGCLAAWAGGGGCRVVAQ
jgi:hypothetical protein